MQDESENPPLDKELERLAAHYTEPNWDGYKAAPVSEAALQLAGKLVDQITSICSEKGVALPDVSASPDSSVIYEWINGRKRFAIMVDEDGLVNYSFLNGESRVSGRDRYSGKLSDTVQGLIARFN